MIGYYILAILIIIEIALTYIRLYKRSYLIKEKSILRITEFILFLMLVIRSIIDWGFQWYMLGLLLFIQALIGIYNLTFKKNRLFFKKGKIVFSCANNILIILMALTSALAFPQYEPVKTTGEHKVETISYTITDESRQEYFTEEEDDKRNVTVQFWYPAEKGNYPLIIFSHGAFGYRMSNYSTYNELASNGYVVCSIDHTYHAFVTMQEDGKSIIANMDFINDAIGASNGLISDEELYEKQQEWMKLRLDDMNFVLDYIKAASSSSTNSVFKRIDLEDIGVMGHSMGGATAAAIGRSRDDVDAVIVLDGTMFGEIRNFENGKNIITDVPYSKPILNIYNESHYEEALADNNYPNSVANKNALNSYSVVFKGSGHMNFTDLPIISPVLAGMLGKGDIDARYCIETTNNNVLQFFNYYLKTSGEAIKKLRIQ